MTESTGRMFDLIAYDADDRLCQMETRLQATAGEFVVIVTACHLPDWIRDRLFATEIKNLRHFGYGIMGFTLSMMETAVELTEGRGTGAEINTILGWGRDMLQAPISLLDGARETVAALAG